MPQINLKQSGSPVADFAVSGNMVTVAGLSIDCAARQEDTAVTIEIRAHKGEVVEGGQDGAYLAHIHIPARTYTEVPAEGGEEGLDGEQPQSERVADPLDHNAVVVTLWPVA
ncbi:hypothetical protein PU634_05265 [Oceanimonas pelagia]|uniref:Uncharacterized protein n=1 Tax=Oceanimonas pelagia TaxID=3028314 RepID=A0AA50KR73_9GAMM|nr:hypothetical protein [Oceanimonas pelagia]WMC11778.1 hypothetical protein PU634_05265 [Oceanimonas pelagia]